MGDMGPEECGAPDYDQFQCIVCNESFLHEPPDETIWSDSSDIICSLPCAMRNLPLAVSCLRDDEGIETLADYVKKTTGLDFATLESLVTVGICLLEDGDSEGLHRFAEAVHAYREGLKNG